MINLFFLMSGGREVFSRISKHTVKQFYPTYGFHIQDKIP